MSWRRLEAKNTSTQMALRKKKCRSPPRAHQLFWELRDFSFQQCQQGKLLTPPLKKSWVRHWSSWIFIRTGQEMFSEISKCHIFLIWFPIWIIFAPFCKDFLFSLFLTLYVIFVRTSPFNRGKRKAQRNKREDILDDRFMYRNDDLPLPFEGRIPW